jgi:diguanylate cyclase (GGDEF)-like protein
LAATRASNRFAVIVGATRQPKDILARFGGDEFLVLLPNTDLREGCRIAERMRCALLEADILHEGPGTHGVVSASFGVGSAATKTMSPRTPRSTRQEERPRRDLAERR